MPISKSNGAVAQTPTGETAPAPVNAILAKRVLETPKAEENRKEYRGDYDSAKNERILRQGVYQAVVQSPGIAGLSFTNIDEYLALVEKAAEAIIYKVSKP